MQKSHLFTSITKELNQGLRKSNHITDKTRIRSLGFRSNTLYIATSSVHMLFLNVITSPDDIPSSCTTKLLVTRGGVLPLVLVRKGDPL